MISTGQPSKKKLDRRVIRTRHLLRDSLMKLILERGYDTITIQDITDAANLGRATFYLHYKDKEELMMQSLEEIFEDLIAKAGPPGSAERAGSRPSLIAFQHAAQYQALYRVMLSSRGGASLTQRLREYLAETTKVFILNVIPETKLPLPIDIIANDAAGAMLSLLIWWLEHDQPYSAEYMAEAFFRLHFEAFRSQLDAAP